MCISVLCIIVLGSRYMIIYLKVLQIKLFLELQYDGFGSS